MKIELNGKQVSKKDAETFLSKWGEDGKERLKARVAEAKDYAVEEPGEAACWMDGMSIKF